MVRLAAADNPSFEVDPAEVEAAQASFTILTLERLRATLGTDRPMVLLLGVDAFLGLAHLKDAGPSCSTSPMWRWPTGLGYTLDESRLRRAAPPRGTAPRRARSPE